MYTPETKAVIEELRPTDVDYAADLALIDSVQLNISDPDASLKLARYAAARAEIAARLAPPTEGVVAEEVAAPMQQENVEVAQDEPVWPGEEAASAPAESPAPAETYQG